MLEQLNRLLELLWGMEVLPNTRCTAWIPRPHGFIVVEPYQPVPSSREWTLYLARKEGLSTIDAVGILKRETGARGYTVYGLKDKNAIAYQYVSLYKPERTPQGISLGKLEAWLVSPRASPLRPGGHGRNIFRITLETGDPECAREIASKAAEAGFYPNYIGPQRFGVCKPDTHLQGLAISMGEEALGVLIENRGYKLGKRGSRSKHTLRPPHPSLTLQALQSYVFNRSLSTALHDNMNLDSLGGKRRLPCPERKERVPMVPLPGRATRSTRTPWNRLIEWVLEEEGLPPSILDDMESPLRALVAAPCRVHVRTCGGRVSLVFSLPRGSYATVYLRSLVRLDWRRECVNAE